MDRCEYYYKCKFRSKYQNATRVVNEDWINTYCNDWFKSEDCARKLDIINSECGCQPVESLTPVGDYLK